MQLTRLIYFSRRVSAETHDLTPLLARCHVNNGRRHITGFLLAQPTYFIQVLEGSRQAINDLYGRLLGDTRHTKLMLIQFSNVPERLFASWSMGLQEHWDERVQAIVLRYSANDVIDPATIDPEALLRILRDLATDAADTAFADLLKSDGIDPEDAM